ncbi:MAG: MFS transporter [Bacillota bacterium]
MPRPTMFNTLFRRLLQLDKPLPTCTPESFAADVQRNYRWNFTFNLLDGANGSLGISFLSATTIVPLFISKLTDSALAIGVAAMIAQGGWYLPQLFTSRFVERLARKKPVVVNLGFFTERIPMWLLILAALLAVPHSAGTFPLGGFHISGSTAALALFLFAYGWHYLGAGLVGTAWQNLLARCFPVESRGRFYGTTQFVGAGAGAVAAVFCSWILDRFDFPINFAVVFALSAIFINLSWLSLAFTREPLEPMADPPAAANTHFLAQLPQILRRDANYRRFLIARVILALGNMGAGFITVAAVRRWHLPDGIIGRYAAAYLVGQTIGPLVVGFLADHLGHKLSVELSALSAATSFAIAWLAPSPMWFYASFVLAGASYGALVVSGMLVVFEFCTSDKVPTYTGLTNTMVGLTNMAAPLLGAYLSTLSYNWLFATSAAVSLLAMLLLHFWVHEPRWAAAPEVPVEEYAMAGAE